MPDAVRAGLAARGHHVVPVAHVAGGMCAIAFEPDGRITGAACWRADGTPVAIGGGYARPGIRFWPDRRNRRRRVAPQPHTDREDPMDRYTKIVLTVIAVALAVIAVRPLMPSVLERVRPDVAQAQTITPKYEVTVPKSWGKYVAFSNDNLLLESADGLRIVDVEGKGPEYPKVKVLIRWQ